MKMQSIPSTPLRQNLPQPQLIRRLHAFAEKRGIQLYLVGGSIRDLLLNRSVTDLDFALADDAIAFAKAFADEVGGAFVKLEEQPPTARIVIRETRLALDFAGFRAETLEADTRLRDLTINAMALKLSSLLTKPQVNLIDPCGGFSDLKTRTLRFPSEQVVLDDALRLLRIYRFSAQLGFEIPEASINLIHRHRNRLVQVSPERIRDELIKILAVKNAAAYLRRMDETRLLSQIIPEIEEIRGLDHSLLALEMFETKPIPDTLRSYHPQIKAYLCEHLSDGVCRRPLIKLALLLHEVGTEMAVAITNRLRLSRKMAKLLHCLVPNHRYLMNLINAPQPARRMMTRLLRSTGDDWLGVLLLSYAKLRASQAALSPERTEEGARPSDYVSKAGELSAQTAELYYQEIRPMMSRGSLITGDDLIQTFGLEPGIKIGRTLKHLEDLQFEGKLHTPEEALKAARTFLESDET